MEPNKLAVQRLFQQCFNEGRVEVLDEIATPETTGPMKTSTLALRGGFPDIHYVLEDLVAEGENVAVRWTWSGTHTGTFVGPQATYEPTQQRVTNTGMAVFQVKNGRITASKLETDRLGFLLQLGVIPREMISRKR